MSAEDTPILSVRDLMLSFAGVRALDGVDLEVAPGMLMAVIGPNGAGKTSLFNCISGVYRPTNGTIAFDGQVINAGSLADKKSVFGRAGDAVLAWMGRKRRLSPQRIAGLGVARMFQNLALFEQLTVLENLLLGRHQLYRSGWASDLLWLPWSPREEVRHRRVVEDIIDFLHLERYRKLPVAIVPYGIRKRIELGRALAMEPKLLLLDEPAAGLNQEETEDMARYVLDIKDELGIAQILIEHDLRFVLDLADRVTVLDFGKKIAEGTPAEIRTHPAVVEAYVGMGGGGDDERAA